MGSPSPSPSILYNEQAGTLLASSALLAVVGIIIALIVLIMFAAMLIKASRYPMPTPLVAPLAMLALVAMVIGAFADQPELIPLAGTGLGALAAVLTTQLGKGKDPEE